MIPYASHSVSEEDIAAVADALRSSRITQGEQVPAFERELAAYCGASECVVVSSGTAALHLACVEAGLTQGKRAIVPSLTFVATANAVAYTGATPVLADVEWGTWNLDIDDAFALSAVDVHNGVDAVLPVYFAGLPVDIERIRDRLGQSVKVIADACHAFGATLDGNRLGEMGAEFTCLSFHAIKGITTGEGGAILVNDRVVADRLRSLRDHGRELSVLDAEPWASNQKWLGWNYRLTDFQCALGISQLQKAPMWRARRAEIAAYYLDNLPESVVCQDMMSERVKHGHHIFPVWLDPEHYDRRDIYHHLHEMGVGVQVTYKPVHLQPYYRDTYGARPGDCPNAERFYAGALNLPLYAAMSDAHVEYVLKAVVEVIA